MQELCRKTEYRCAFLDSLRGLTVISMVLYHAMWDLTWFWDMDMLWFKGTGGYLWQQITCCTFFLLSGFCSAMGRKTIKRGVFLLFLGTAISLVTMIVMPEQKILFGVLTLLGSCMILVGLMKPFLLKWSAGAGMVIAFLLFAITKPINQGALGLFSKELFVLPEGLYRNYFTAYLGFPHEGFFSTDYFSLMPWGFLFFAGFFLYKICGKRVMETKWKGIALLNMTGRHALLIYVVHQPFIYMIVSLFR